MKIAKKKILFYYKLFFAGGIESSIFKFAQKLSNDYELYVMYDDEQSQNVVLERISKYAKIINYNDLSSLSVDTCIWCSHPRQLTFDEFTSKVHANKYICWGHILLFDTYPDYEFDENFIKNVDKFVNVSQTVEDDLLGKYPFLKDRSIVLENYMNIDEIRRKSNEEIELHVDKSKLNIITTARIAFDKGYKRMKTLCDVFDKHNVKYDWYVLGKAFKSEVYDEITGWFKDNKNVHFLGYQNNVYPYIKQMDYAAILSDREANNLSISEAFAIGIPCIVSNFKGVTAQVDDGKTGIIISLDNTESNYEEKLDRILNDKEELTTNVRNKDCSKEYLMDIWAELFDDKRINENK